MAERESVNEDDGDGGGDADVDVVGETVIDDCFHRIMNYEL